MAAETLMEGEAEAITRKAPGPKPERHLCR